MLSKGTVVIDNLANFLSVSPNQTTFFPSVENIPTAEFGMIAAETACLDIRKKIAKFLISPSTFLYAYDKETSIFLHIPAAPRYAHSFWLFARFRIHSFAWFLRRNGPPLYLSRPLFIFC
jgi:hypothetical protein